MYVCIYVCLYVYFYSTFFKKFGLFGEKWVRFPGTPPRGGGWGDPLPPVLKESPGCCQTKVGRGETWGLSKTPNEYNWQASRALRRGEVIWFPSKLNLSRSNQQIGNGQGPQIFQCQRQHSQRLIHFSKIFLLP